MINMNKMSIENQHIFLAPRKHLGVGRWGLDNPYGVRILNPLEITGRSLRAIPFEILRGGAEWKKNVEISQNLLFCNGDPSLK